MDSYRAEHALSNPCNCLMAMSLVLALACLQGNLSSGSLCPSLQSDMLQNIVDCCEQL